MNHHLALSLFVGTILMVTYAEKALAQMPPARFDHAFVGELEQHRVLYGHAWDVQQAVAEA